MLGRRGFSFLGLGTYFQPMHGRPKQSPCDHSSIQIGASHPSCRQSGFHGTNSELNLSPNAWPWIILGCCQGSSFSLVACMKWAQKAHISVCRRNIGRGHKIYKPRICWSSTSGDKCIGMIPGPCLSLHQTHFGILGTQFHNKQIVWDLVTTSSMASPVGGGRMWHFHSSTHTKPS
jgi:hypothetical protein